MQTQFDGVCCIDPYVTCTVKDYAVADVTVSAYLVHGWGTT